MNNFFALPSEDQKYRAKLREILVEDLYRRRVVAPEQLALMAIVAAGINRSRSSA